MLAQTGRTSHASVVIVNKILVMGGYRMGRFLNSVELYDPAKNEWCLTAPMLERRCHFQAGTVGNFVYIFGGKRNLILSSVERYSISDNSWTMVSNFYLSNI